VKVAEAAKKLGISERSLYRLIKERLISYTLEVVNRPTLAYSVDDDFIYRVQQLLAADPSKGVSPARIRTILQNMKGDK